MMYGHHLGGLVRIYYTSTITIWNKEIGKYSNRDFPYNDPISGSQV